MKEIKLKDGNIALIDDEDFDLVSSFRWTHRRVDNISYAYASFKNKNVLMHRIILKAQKGQIIDHIDWNGLNNQKSNLRFCTQRQNTAHKRITPSNGYRGITWRKRDRIWEARVSHKYAGVSTDKILCARMYDRLAKEMYGEYAVLNFK